ncbi:MAG: hypothetical protein JW712_03105 [Dehalococcoidales bacterium]|nr:hypothetical protein [Dehalococcoidales bacterium]
MARKAVVDKDVILDMLKAGETTQRIADHFNVSRQAIDLHRKDFIARGLVTDRRAIRRKSVNSQTQSMFSDTVQVDPTVNCGTEHTGQPEHMPELAARETDTSIISLDYQIDLLISAFSALKRVSVLEKELDEYKKENEKISREIERLKDRELKRTEQESRWMRVQTGSDDTSISTGNKLF